MSDRTDWQARRGRWKVEKLDPALARAPEREKSFRTLGEIELEPIYGPWLEGDLDRVGLPGEVVEGRGGRVYVDGLELYEPYLDPNLATEPFGPVTVPDGHVFVMGDNRLPNMSQDSRVFGPVPIDSIVGRAVARAWLPDRVANL